MSFQEDLEKILEDLHEKLLIGWIKNDGKTHVIPGHANKDGCINDTLTSIINLVDKDIIGSDELPIDIHLTDKNTAIFLNNKIAFCNGLRKEQRNKLRGEIDNG